MAKPFGRTSARVTMTAVVVSVSVVIYHKQEALETLFLKFKSKHLLADAESDKS